LVAATLLKGFVRIHSEQSYHFDYAYGTQFVLWAAIATLLVGLSAYTFFRRSFYGVLPALAIMGGLVTAHVGADMLPSVFMMSSTTHQLGHAEKALSDWDETHGRFPGNETELREALARVLAEPSHFSWGKTPVVCKVEMVRNAVSASDETTATQPGMLIYAVRQDSAEYWLTVTTLEGPTSSRIVVYGVAGLYNPMIVHRTHLKPGEGHWPHFE
jgi:hypothetical protein